MRIKNAYSVERCVLKNEYNKRFYKIYRFQECAFKFIRIHKLYKAKVAARHKNIIGSDNDHVLEYPDRNRN